ncbi:MAG: glucosyltransferase [Rickettsiales bacterium]|nr:glucosyltransferase [Rickettsiales bacterium]
MRILHLASGSLSGGASKGCFLLHNSLLKMGLDSRVLISGQSTSRSFSITSPHSSFVDVLKYKVKNKVLNSPKYFYPKRRRGYAFDTGFSGENIINLPVYQNSDIIHLHWINGLVSLKTISLIKKPIIWTLRDMWPFTGGCHYSMGCLNFQQECGRCPQLGSNIQFDLSHLILSRKTRLFSPTITFVGISNWISQQARSSSLCSESSVHTIHNSVDTDTFSPMNVNVARDMLGLPSKQKIILVGAINILDFYKGFSLFVDSLKYLGNRLNISIVTFGKQPSDQYLDNNLRFIHLGYLSDKLLRLAYCSADVFVAPSRMEAFGKTLAESLACGTPVVGFDACGPRDIIDHKVTGYKAVPYEPFDLARGITYLLDLPGHQRTAMSINCRSRALNLFHPSKIAYQYHDLYTKHV